jgi:hypothetical protein
MDTTLQKLKGVIFIKEHELEIITEEQQQNIKIVKELLSCYHVQEEGPDEDDPRDIQMKEFEGEREVEGPPL